MARKFLIFISASILLLLLNLLWIQNQRPKQANQANNAQQQDGDGGDPANADDPNAGNGNPGDGNQGDADPDNANPDNGNADNPPVIPNQPEVEHQRSTLGSLDPESDFVMLVTANNRGGTIERIELNNPRFRELEARRDGRGYLGYLAPRALEAGAEDQGIRVTVVGPGTPAAVAGVKVGDVITSVTPEGGEAQPITSVVEWEALLLSEAAKVDKKWTLNVVDAGGNEQQRQVTLAPVPLSIVEPVTSANDAVPDPYSMRLTLQKIQDMAGNSGDGQIVPASDIAKYFVDGQGALIVGKLPETHPLYLAGLREGYIVKTVDYDDDIYEVGALQEYLARVPSGSWLRFGYGADGAETALVRLPAEMPGMNLHDVNWELNQPAGTDNVIEFTYTDAKWNLRYTKRFTLAKKSEAAETSQGQELPPVYHLMMDMEIENLGSKRELIYQLDGFNGLPTEGWWYSSKLARGWFEGVGARDVLFEFVEQSPDLIGAPRIAEFDELPKPGGEVALQSVSSDSRYFAGSLLPQRDEASALWFQTAMAVRVGAPQPPKLRRLTNTSFRLLSQPVVLEQGESLQRSFRLFAGPKSTALLAEPQYQLSELVYYGWPIWGIFAKILQGVLHFIYGIIPNYAVAILLLTVMVRGAMFPLSRKNALGAQKMQMLQPEIRRLNEKYKNNPQERMRATQELFKKHNYHPLGGCLVLFLQLPIFIGLYRALMLDVELRQAPLIPGFTAWCDNLAAPDMLFYWGDWGFMPDFLVSYTGFLGPYFNLLPILTIGLFIAQQKILMPPPMDDQQRMQQKMMKYMMVFFAFMFFRVPAGLCLYFIASSLWGLAERKLLPKPNKDQQQEIAVEDSGDSPRERRRQSASGNGASGKSSPKNKRFRD